jgi:antagonist of KipI
MSLQIINAGVLDSIQDLGRYGYQHLGINPTGAMDRFAASVANALLGKELTAPVMELHFPSAKILFEQPAVFSIAGGNFSPTINQQPVPMYQPVAVAENSVLEFTHIEKGFRAYLSFLPEIKIEPWLESFSTNLKAGAGGFQGRTLLKNDRIEFLKTVNLDALLKEKRTSVIHMKAAEIPMESKTIECVLGSEWNRLTMEGKEIFNECWFEITAESDRMGYRLKGRAMALKSNEQMISSPAGFGTIQVLPNGQLIVLMADHQTTGGYPKVGHVITADLPLLAQKSPGSVIKFKLTELAAAEKKWLAQQAYLRQIQEAAGTRLRELGLVL